MLGELLCAALILAVSWLFLGFNRVSNLPPGPFAWPIIGNLRWFQKDPQGYKKFTELATKYGNVYR